MPQTDEGIKRLTPKQKLFCHFYAQSKNATDAATRAGYSEKTARFIGCENLTKPNIQAYLNELYAEAIGNAPQGAIATIEEIMQFHTEIMRAEEGGIAIKDRQRSANSLYEMLKQDDGDDDDEGGVIVLPEVKVRE